MDGSLRRLTTLGVQPPRADAGRAERRRFVRDLNARSAVISAALLVLALAVAASLWLIVLIAAGLLATLIDVAWLTVTLRRDR
jgi:energy-converting hydrogenase Eha subunit E